MDAIRAKRDWEWVRWLDENNQWLNLKDRKGRTLLSKIDKRHPYKTGGVVIDEVHIIIKNSSY
jgi:hypothetical protein